MDENDCAIGHDETLRVAVASRSTRHRGTRVAYGPGVELATISRRARRLGSVLEPVVGQVYFSPECHANYEALGFDPSPGDADGVALADGPAYFASRGSLLGQVPGEVIAAAFGVFCAAVPLVRLAWTRTDAATMRRARADGAVARLQRLLGDRPDGTERVLELLLRAAAHLPINGRAMAAGITAPEVVADGQMMPSISALGGDVDELFEILAPWGEAIRPGRGYLGAGPHDLG